MRVIKGETVATRRDYYEAIKVVAEQGTDFNGLDVLGFVNKELAKLDKEKGKSRKLSEAKLAEYAEKDAAVLAVLTDEPQSVKTLAKVMGDVTPQSITASLKRLVKDGKVAKSEFEGINLYKVA